jgi:hypothetical protein
MQDRTRPGIEIAPHIRVLAAGEHGWAVWVDGDDEAPCYPTQDQAVRFARQRAEEDATDA